MFTDPQNYGYCHGIKFVSLQQLARYKTRRGEPNKDNKDVAQIKTFLEDSGTPQPLTSKIQKVVITGASSNHFDVLIGFLDNYIRMAEHTNIPLFVYDLGLSNVQATHLEKHYAKVVIRTFEYEKYPSYFDINIARGEYAWKPAIIKSVLEKEAKAVLWLDSGDRLTGRNTLNNAFRLIDKDGFLSTTTSGTTQTWVYPDTRKFLNAETMNKPMCNGAIVGANEAAYEKLIVPWWRCALNRNCIAPAGSSRKNHRQDQAVLTILVWQNGYTCPGNRLGIKIHQDYLTSRKQQEAKYNQENSHGINICKKAVCVKTHPNGGIGHRLTNMLQGKMMSLALKLPLGTPNLEIGQSHGEKYAGLNDLFPLSEHIVDCSSQDTSTDWRVESLDFTLKKGSVFDLKSKTIQTLRIHANKAACNTVFTVKEFWPRDYEATFPWLRNIFTIGMQSTTGKNIIKNSVYDKSRFNIAIHFRNGDITPTPPAYFQAVIRELLTDLKPLTILPIDITIFSENFAELPNKLRKIATGSGLNVRVKTNKESSAVATMVHFGLADIFIASDSSMGYIPTWIAGNTSNPVVIAAPSTRTAQTWASGTIRADIKGTYGDREKIISKANSFLKIESLQSTKKRKSVVGVVFVLSHSSRSKSGVTGLERRNSIRETWKKDVPDDSIFRFVMDKTSSLEILNEAKTYGDIIFLETKQKGQAREFGKKLMEMSKWALQNYDFKYMFRVDDDNFLCIEHIFHDLKSLQYPESIVWGWWVADPLLMNPPLGTFSMDSPNIGNVCSGYSGTINAKNNWRPDEMLIIISANLVEEMFGGTKLPRTWDLMDVTIIRLLKNTKITYMVDNARIQRGFGTYGPNAGPNNIQSYCKTNIAYHKAHPEMMKKLWKSGYEDYNNYNTVKIHKNCIKN